MRQGWEEKDMNWTRILLDGVLMAVFFNLFAVAVVAINPRYMMASYPKEIQKAAPQPVTKRELTVYRKCMVVMIALPLLYGAGSLARTGMEGFWILFAAGYIEWLIVSMTDFVFLDIIMLEVMKGRMMVPGTEEHPGYRLKNWMLRLALPEHFLGWPLVICPIFGLVQAGCCMVFRML